MAMHLSNERLIIILIVGAIAGWLIGKILRGNGFGLVGDAAIGVVGALIGEWILPRFNFHFWSGMTGMIVEASIGAIVLLVALRSIGASGWGGAR
jgi:uncharacterized membrane protein YeaQ/YmgE (transglycosylase-associated protein family)